MKNFSINRFTSIFKLYWVSQSRTPYFVLGIMLILGLVILTISALNNETSMWIEPPFTAFVVCLWISGAIYLGQSFSELNPTRSAVSFFTLPASVFEKWFAKFILAFIVFPVIAIVSYQIVFGLFNLLSPALFAVRFRGFDWGGIPTKTAFLVYFLIGPLAFVSGLLWRRFGLLKTAFGVIIYMAVLSLCLSTFDTYIPGTSVFEITSPFVGHTVSDEMVALNRRFWFCMAYIPSGLLLLASYFLIKEYEI